MTDPYKNPHINGECGIDEAHSDEDHQNHPDRELTADEMDAARIDNIDPSRDYPVRLSHLTDWERRQVALSKEPARFFVWWTDYVANEWAEVVEGPEQATERRLLDLAEAGKEDFGMEIRQIPGGKVQPTMTDVQFFALDWAEWLGAPTTD